MLTEYQHGYLEGAQNLLDALFNDWSNRGRLTPQQRADWLSQRLRHLRWSSDIMQSIVQDSPELLKAPKEKLGSENG